MIGQQFYTRERGGLFNRNNGYDSIAKSENVSLEFIKKAVHPLCNYEAPISLQNLKQIDESRYPVQFIVKPAESGELIVGQASFKSLDFTGRRSTFFMHNYIIDEESKMGFIKAPEKIFGMTEFAKNYDVNQGRVLPNLTEVAYQAGQRLFLEKHQLFRELGLNEALFKKMLYAIISAMETTQKVYICLDVPIETLSIYSKALSYHLYKKLPWELLKNLSLSTYAHHVETPYKVMFIDKETLQSETLSSSDFIFDFINKSFPSFELEEEPYFKMLFHYFDSQLLWEEFNNLVTALEPFKLYETHLSLYNEVAQWVDINFYRKLKKPYQFKNEEERKSLLEGLLKEGHLELPKPYLEYLQRLKAYLLEVAQQNIDTGRLLEQLEIELLFEIKPREQFIKLLADNLDYALTLRDSHYINELLNASKEQEALYIAIIEAIFYEKPLREQIGYQIIEQSLENISYIESFIERLDNLLPFEPIFIKDGYYEKQVKKCFEGVMERTKHQAELLKRVQIWCEHKDGILKPELLGMCETYFLKQVRLKDLTSEAALCDLKFSKPYMDSKNYVLIEKYKKLKRGSELILGEIEVEEALQRLVRRFHKKWVQKEDFPLIAYGFLESVGTGYEVNVEKALNYLYEINAELSLDFICWLKGKKNLVDIMRFDEKVVEFFSPKKQDKALVKQKLQTQEKTKRLYSQINEAWQPPIVKFVLMNKIGVIIGVALVIAVGLTSMLKLT